jgi:hypothetical protein
MITYKKTKYEILVRQCFALLLVNPIVIPNENRFYEWTGEKWIIPVLEQINNKMKNMESNNIGQFIVLRLPDTVQYIIYDAQHRITTILMFLVVIGELGDSDMRIRILRVVAKDSTESFDDTLTDEEHEICKTHGWRYMPRLRSQNRTDFIALGNLVNSLDPNFKCISETFTKTYKCSCGEFTSSIKGEIDAHVKAHSSGLEVSLVCSNCKYSGNLEGHSVSCKSKKALKYSCNSCDHTETSKGKINEHMKIHKVSYDTKYTCDKCRYSTGTEEDIQKHMYIGDDDIVSNIPAAYDTIKQYVTTKMHNVPHKEIYHYILKEVGFDIRITESEEDARAAYENNNLIGMSVSMYDLLKTYWISKISNRKPDIIHVFDELRRIYSNHISSPLNHQDIVYISSNIVRKYWEDLQRFNTSGYKKLLDDLSEVECNTRLDEFIKITQKATTLLDHITNDRFYRISSELATGCEIMKMFIVPVGLIFGQESLTRYLNLVISASLVFESKKRDQLRLNINSLGFQTPIKIILGKLMAGELTDDICYNEFRNVFKSKIIDKSEFIRKLTTMKFRTNVQVKVILQYLVEKLFSHEARVDIDKVDLEHIVSQNKMSTLNDPDLAYNIGNMTLFCGPNSGSLRGNRSLKDLPFLEKLVHYEKSNIKITTDLVNYKETGFSDTQILERSKELASLIYSIVVKELDI